MAELKIFDQNGKESGTHALKGNLWKGEPVGHLLYLALRKQLAGARQGTHSTKRRDEVSGTGKKPWKQKGTGRARSGSVRSPLWRHGGSIFGPKPRDYSFELPREAGRIALISALRNCAKDGKMALIEDLKISKPKTREVASILKKLNSENALLLIDKKNENLTRAARNLPFVKVLPIGSLNVHDLLRFKKVLLTKETLNVIERSWGQTSKSKSATNKL